MATSRRAGRHRRSGGDITDADAFSGEMRTLAQRAGRLTLLDAPHMAPLEALRASVAARHGPTPRFDPLDGGTGARLLVLLETPGPRGEEPRFVSRDNPTGTARNLRRFLFAAGLARADTVLWNAVPWTIHAPGARNRGPRAGEVAAGVALLPDLLDLLPVLRVAVLSGRVAARAGPLLAVARPGVAVLAMPHPSPTIVCTAPAIGERIASTLAVAARLIAEP